MQYTADMLLTNGRFLTMEDANPTAEAVAIRAGQILFVGTDAEARKHADENTEVIDLGGRVASPAFLECHTHPTHLAAVLTKLNCRGENTASLDALLACIRERAAKTPKGEWISATGYDEGSFREGPIPVTSEVLDRAAPEHPLVVSRICGHVCVLNSLAMRIGGIDEDFLRNNPAITGFRDENGRLNGQFSNNVKAALHLPPTPIERLEEGFCEAQEIYLRNGITASSEMSISPDFVHLLQDMNRRGRLKLRIGFYESANTKATYQSRPNAAASLALRTGFGDDRLWFLGFKYFLDGAMGGKTAAVSEPYLGEPDNHGRFENEQERLNESLLLAIKAGVQTSVHAIGDLAVEMALKGYEYTIENGADPRPLRCRLEHLELPTEDHIRRIREMGLTVGLSSAFIYSLGNSHITAVGQERLTHAFPAKTLMDAGITVACNCDCPVCDVNPMLGIYSMVVRKTVTGQSFGGTEESVDRIRALEAYTKNAAHLLWCDDRLGSLKAGKCADIVVFEDDFLAVPDDRLKDVRIRMTVQNGEIVHQL